MPSALAAPLPSPNCRFSGLRTGNVRELWTGIETFLISPLNIQGKLQVLKVNSFLLVN